MKRRLGEAMVPNFSFWSWFERMGYDRPGGEEEFAEMLTSPLGLLFAPDEADFNIRRRYGPSAALSG